MVDRLDGEGISRASGETRATRESQLLSLIACGQQSGELSVPDRDVLARANRRYFIDNNPVQIESDRMRKIILAEIEKGHIDSDLVLTGVNLDRFGALPRTVIDYFTVLDLGQLSGILNDRRGFPDVQNAARQILTSQYLDALGVRNETHIVAVWKILQIRAQVTQTQPPPSN